MAQGGISEDPGSEAPNAEAQEMAASFGLGPPRRPPGMRAPVVVKSGQSLYSYPARQHSGDEDVLDRQTVGHGQEQPESDDQLEGEGPRSFGDVLADRQARKD